MSSIATQTITIAHSNLVAAAAFVPAAERLRFFATLLVGSEVLHMDQLDSAIDETETTSFAISVEQGRQLKSKLDEGTWEVLTTMVANAQDDVGTIGWADVKRITGVKNWNVFAKGRLGGLHRSLRKIAGDPNALLVWEGEGWVEDGEGDYSAGSLCIDGPAVRVIRSIASRGSNS